MDDNKNMMQDAIKKRSKGLGLVIEMGPHSVSIQTDAGGKGASVTPDVPAASAEPSVDDKLQKMKDDAKKSDLAPPGPDAVAHLHDSDQTPKTLGDLKEVFGNSFDPQQIKDQGDKMKPEAMTLGMAARMAAAKNYKGK